ncbi:MAG: quinolinate synthase NadA, partial [Candidatus Hydrogenedentota bacterium]
YTVYDIQNARRQFPDVKIITHPECREEVTRLADFSGSTSQMADYIRNSHAKSVLLLTECSMGDNLRGEFPNVEFISTCQTCPHMKKITLEKVKAALENEQYEVDVPEDVRVRAEKAVKKMLEIGR